MTAPITNSPPSFPSICNRLPHRRQAPRPPCTTRRRPTLHPRHRRRSCPSWRSTTRASRTPGIHLPMTDSRSAVLHSATALSWPKIGKTTLHWVRGATTTFLRIRVPVSGSSLAQAASLSNVGPCSIRRRIRRLVDPFCSKTLTERTGEWRFRPGRYSKIITTTTHPTCVDDVDGVLDAAGDSGYSTGVTGPNGLRLLDGACRRSRHCRCRCRDRSRPHCRGGRNGDSKTPRHCAPCRIRGSCVSGARLAEWALRRSTAPPPPPWPPPPGADSSQTWPPPTASTRVHSGFPARSPERSRSGRCGR